MLKQLHIQNYALIDSVNLSLSEGLSVITGETGAGKSILLGAIALLMGARADSKSLYDPEKKCIIEGTFALTNYPHIRQLFEEEGLDFEDPCIIRREINPQGKSRTFVNDSPVTLDSLRKIGQELIDAHSQQDTWWMSHPDFSLELIDSFAQNQSLKSSYTLAFQAYTSAQEHVDNLVKQAASGMQGLDFMQFQFQELESAQLRTDEFEGLEIAVDKGENAEQIHEKLAGLANLLSLDELSIGQQMRLALQHTQSLSKWDPTYEAWKARLDSIWIELKDLSNEVEREAEDFQSDPASLLRQQQRLDLLNRLLQKYQVTDITSLIDMRNQLDDQIARFSNMDEAIAKAKAELATCQATAEKASLALSESRNRVLDPIVVHLTDSLAALGIPNATLAWENLQREMRTSGIDKIQLLFSANKGLSPKPFKQVASGGELSRLMLSIKHLLAQKRALPTLILDEIDTGVSGEIAIKIGQMLTQMSQGHQLIAITHLPQIAAAGIAHWYVYKDHAGEKTVSSLRELKGEERVDEIAKMIGGQQGYVELKDNVRKLIQANHAK
ncbi:MAG: DNA repair protein RecN [Cytophagaceae bacterium]|nr:DNA repair protein RecN [Cytophagaceae bacterium]MBP6092772.1 DNA repair protein RecN [Cytophagaceae bacterium]